mgnify:CR=1 FL=1
MVARAGGAEASPLRRLWLARALRDVHDPADARLLAVAFDPCVEFDIDSGIDCTPAMEPAHA